MQALVRIGAGGQQAGQRLVVVHQSGGAAQCEGIELAGVVPARDRIVALAIAQAEVDVHAAAAHREYRLGHEGQHDAVLESDFTRQQAEQEDVVHRLDGAVVGERELELGRIVFGVHAVDAKARCRGLFPQGIREAPGVGKWACGIHMGRRRVVGFERAVGLDLEGKSFELDAHHRVIAHGLPVGHGAFQGAAPAHGQGRAIVGFEVANGHLGERLPARADVFGGVGRFHVGQAFHDHRARGRDQLFFVSDAKSAPAKTGTAALTRLERDVFAPRNGQVVAIQHPQALLNI